MSAHNQFLSMFVLSFTLWGCTESASGEWIEIGRLQSDNSPFFMHSQLQTFANDSGLAVITARFQFNNPRSDTSGGPYRMVVSKLLLNCVGSEASEIGRVAFERADATGDKRIITNRTPEEAKTFLAPLSDPAIHALHSVACKKIANNQVHQ